MDTKLFLLLGLNLFLFLLVWAFKRKRRLSNFFLLLFTTLFILTLIEVIYRVFFKKNAFVEKGNFGMTINTLNPIYGYTVKNIKKIRHTKILSNDRDTVFNATYTIIQDTGINKQDINHRVGYNSVSGSDSLEVVFFGCSFTFGSGINDNETLPYQFGKFSEVNTLNMSSGGWGTHQVYRLFRNKYGNVPDKMKRVFIYSFIPDHLLRAKCIYSWDANDPYYTVRNDTLHLAGPAYKNSGPAKIHLAARFFTLAKSLSFLSDLENNLVTLNASKKINDQDYKRIQLMLNEINSTIRGRNDKFIILHWNDYKGPQPGTAPFVSEEKINNIFIELQKKGATIINISDILDINDSSNFIVLDNHPNGIGNGKIAQHLVNRFIKNDTFSSAGKENNFAGK